MWQMCSKSVGKGWETKRNETRRDETRSMEKQKAISKKLLPILRRHLARNPFICDCNLRWLNAYLHAHPIETSGAKCESPKRAQKRKIDSMRDDKFKCKGKHDPISLISSLLKRIAGTHGTQVGTMARSEAIFSIFWLTEIVVAVR